MKLMLINCPSSLDKPFENNEPLGILYIASMLLEHGHDVAARDFGAEAYKKDECARQVIDQSYDGLLISCRTASYDSCRQIITDCHDSGFQGLTILGGQHPSALPERTLEEIPVDPLFIVRGEGEETVVRLASVLSGHWDVDSLLSVKGISFKLNGVVYSTSDRELIPEIDRLPFPARHLLNNELYTMDVGGVPAFNMITSRGCPYHCIYCQKNIFKRKIRFRSPENIAREISELTRVYGRDAFYFVDDLFTADIQRLEALFEILDRENIRIRWRCLSRADKINETILRKMKAWGCEKIVFGFESGDSYTLKKVNKAVGIDTIRRAAFLTHQAGIRFKANFMVGFPWDDVWSVMRTFRFAASLPVNDEYKVFSVTPFPGTKIWELYIEENLIDEHHIDWKEFQVTDYSITHSHIPPAISNNLLILFYLYMFYSRLFRSFTRKANWRLFLTYVFKINIKKLVKLTFRPAYNIAGSVEGELVDSKYNRYPRLIQKLIQGMMFFDEAGTSQKPVCDMGLHDQKTVAAAKSFLADVVRLNPLNTQARFELARILFHEHQHDMAGDLLRQIMESGGGTFQTALFYGFINRKTLSDDKRLYRYIHDGNYLKSLADMCLTQKQFDHALLFYDKALELTHGPERQSLHRRMAQLTGSMGRHLDACLHYMNVFEHKEDIEIQNALVDEFALFCKIDPRAALSFAENLAASAKDVHRIAGCFLNFYHKIIVYRRMDEACIEKYRTGELYLSHSMLYRMASNLKKDGCLSFSERLFRDIALAETEFIHDDTYKGGACFHLGEILVTHNMITEAEGFFKRCLSMIPDHQKAREYLNQCLKSA